MGVLTRSSTPEITTATTQPQPYNAHRPLRASAQIITLESRTEIDLFTRHRASSTGPSAWQTAAWDYYDEVGEVKYAFSLLANTISRIRLYVGEVEDPARPPQMLSSTATDPTDPAVLRTVEKAVTKLSSGTGGISTMLRDLALNLSVTGEAYLCQIPERKGHGIPESWGIYSADAVQVDAQGNVALKLSSSARMDDWVKLPKTAFVGRIWRNHPRYANDADSSMRGLLTLLEELLLLNRAVRATAQSRLNAGLLYLPDGLTVTRPLGDEPYPEPDDESATGTSTTGAETDELEEELMNAMSAPIQDIDSASAVVPLIMRGPAELSDKIQHLKFERAFDPALAQRADRVLDRILQGLDVPKEVVAGLSQVKYCASEDTEILTKRGWLTYEDLTTDDTVLTLNHETGLSEWQPVLAVNTYPVVDEPMLSLEQRGHSSLTTLDHRWPVIKVGPRVSGSRRRMATSRDLATTDRVPTAAPLADLPSEAKYMDAFVELVAWFWTEGAVHNRDAVRADGSPRRRWVQITQSDAVNPDNVIAIRRALTELMGPPYAVDPSDPAPKYLPAWTESRDGQQVRFMLNDEASAPVLDIVEGRDKIVRTDFIQALTKAQLDLFIATSVAADGYIYPHGGMILHQKIEQRLDAFELACVLSGKPIRRYHHTNGHAVRILSSSTFQPVKSASGKIITSYTGIVWCPTTANRTWFARRNGTTFFTGNSNAVVIDEQFFRSNVEPLALLICDALTTVYLRPFLKAHGHDDAAERLVVWYDPSDVVVRPNRNEDVTTGYDRYVLSSEAWRRVHGFSEDDAPDADEVVKRLVVAKGQLPDALTEALLRVIAPDLMKQAMAASPAGAPGGGLPPEVAQALGVPPSAAPAPDAGPVPASEDTTSPAPTGEPTAPAAPVPPTQTPAQTAPPTALPAAPPAAPAA